MSFYTFAQPPKPQVGCEIHKGAQGPSSDQGGDRPTPMLSHKVRSICPNSELMKCDIIRLRTCQSVIDRKSVV